MKQIHRLYTPTLTCPQLSMPVDDNPITCMTWEIFAPLEQKNNECQQ
jgi:hypothetical protein